MKSIFLLLMLFTTILTSCSDGMGEAPVITIDSIYVNGKLINQDLNKPIPEKATIQVYTTLNAQEGTTLLSFNVETVCNESDGSGKCIAPVIDYVKSDVSNAGFNDMSVLRFKDGVVQTKALISAQLDSSDDNSLMFKLYLNTDDAGTKKEIIFHIGKDIADDNVD